MCDQVDFLLSGEMDLSARAANEDSWCGSSPQNNPFVLFCFLENLTSGHISDSNIATLKVGGMEQTA